MAKCCDAPDCSYPRFSHGFCGVHQYLRTDEKWLRKMAKGREYKPTDKKKRFVNKPIRKYTPKRLKELAIYWPKKDKYLAEHSDCEVHDCGNPSDQLHHKKGRMGKMVYNEEFFMACCGACHPQRIHENSEWAYEYGYLISK